MSDEWTVEEGPSKLDKYEWHLPNNEDQHVEETVAPGDLMIRPEDIDLVPTNSPTQSGIQFGQDTWNYQNAPDSSWYIFGFVED